MCFFKELKETCALQNSKYQTADDIFHTYLLIDARGTDARLPLNHFFFQFYSFFQMPFDFYQQYINIFGSFNPAILA